MSTFNQNQPLMGTLISKIFSAELLNVSSALKTSHIELNPISVDSIKNERKQGLLFICSEKMKTNQAFFQNDIHCSIPTVLDLH